MSNVPENDNYRPLAWHEYEPAEIGWWVHLLLKRSMHRSNTEKRKKDVTDARNYWRMLGEFIDEAEKQIERDGG